MSSKADFNLVVGAEISASYEEMRKDLKVIINTLNKQPYKIKLSLDMASWDKEVSKIKSDINEVRKSFAGTNTATGLGIKATNITGEIKPALSAIEQFNQRIKKIGVDNLDEGRLLNLFSSIGDALREDKVLADNFCEAVNKTYGVKYLEHLIFAVQRYSQNITTATELSKEFDSITNRQFTTEIPALATVDEQSINQLKALRSILRKSDLGWDDPYSKKKFSTYQASSTQLLSAIEQHATSAQLKVLGLQRGLISLSDVQGVLRSLAVNTGAISYNDGYGLDTFKTNSTRIREAISAHKEYEQQIASDNAALSELRNALVSTFGELPSEGGALVVTLDQLKQVESEAPAAMEYISQIQRQINGGLFKQEQSPAPVLEEVKTSVDQVVSSEQSLESATETVKGIFGSGVNSEVLISKLEEIRLSIEKITSSLSGLNSNVEKVNTTVSGLAPRDIVNRDSLEQAVATVNEATQATQVLGNTMGATASRAQEVTKAAQDVATATRGNVAASNELNTSISNLGTTMQAIEDTRIQEIANAELLREAQAEEEAYTNRANTALQNQIDMMLGIGRETKSAEQSMEAFIAAEDEANRTFQNIRTAEPQLKKIADAATKARTFLNSNMEASESPSYQKAITSLERLEIVMEACGTDANNLHSVLRDTGINSTFEIERLNSAISTLRNELVNTGSTGTVSLRNIVDVMNQMQNLAGGNTNLSGAQSFIALTNEIERFQQIVESCGGDATRLEGVLREMGVNGVNEIEAARLAMSNFRTDVVQATNTERANADATREAADARREEERVIRTGATAYRQHAAVALQAENKLRQWSAAERSANQESRNAYANLYNSVRALDAAATAYDGTEDSARNLAAAVQNTRTTLKESERVLKANGEDTQTFGDRLKGLAQKFSAWLSVSQVIMYAVRTVRKMISTSVELDSAMSQMRIVTNATESDMKRFGDTVAETAKRIGASMTDLIDSATVFARLGYSLDESSSLAEYTSMLQKVGDIDVSDAQNAITAITKAYDDIDADNIESTMDKLVKVGNSFPISTAEIAEGLNNAASSLSAAGNTFEESVALLTAANTTVDYCRAA